MMRPDAKVEKVYLYPKPVDFRKSIDGLAALVELDIKVAVFDPILFVFLNKPRNRVKILYWERNGFCLWLKRLESERFKTSPDATDEAIVLRVELDVERVRQARSVALLRGLLRLGEKTRACIAASP
ncbi:IS66 family insertion sequence element accessory protein TnpB [Pseudomonas viridiflava]|uniref:IS66 family insertion sequence element accessory protein TnpB n=5 Tax=Pseudomonas TaxID=286 RepID=UPI001F11B3F9|nr:IS66 family insertion sequence element accessory protein TnpB [Pseudomonas viridiflava]